MTKEQLHQNIIAKHETIADRRWRMKTVNEALIAAGFEPIIGLIYKCRVIS